jgi:predicted nucleic acid-binding Zn ribbon protein
MERAGEFLGRVVRRLERPEAAFAWLASAWPAIVGKALAAHTRPVRCDANCLELTADGKAWQNQIESLQREVCGRINQAWGGNLVRQVKVVAAKPAPNRISHEADNEHIPFIRRRRA